MIDDLGEEHWFRNSVVTAVLPESRPQRILVRNGGAVYAVSADGKPVLVGGELAWRDYTNQDQAYALQVGVDVDRSLPRLSIQHEGSKTTVQVPIPWTHKARPKDAVIGPGGHRVAVVSSIGDVTIIDAPAFAARRGLAKPRT